MLRPVLARELRGLVFAMHDARIQLLNERPPRNGGYVLYWMQASQRAEFNPALEYAIRRADAINLGVVVAFGLMAGYPNANARHFAFMLEGLAEVAHSLRRRGIRFVLHFAQISPVEVALKAQAAKSACEADKAAFLEELIMRRELACNFVQFTANYDDYACLPDWARRTLAKHAGDRRPRRYSRAKLAAGLTEDSYWNAAMQEMRETGYMHNTMRMQVRLDVNLYSVTDEEKRNRYGSEKHPSYYSSSTSRL